LNSIFSVELDETYKRRPHEGSDVELKKRIIVVMEITLSKTGDGLDKSAIGY